MRIGIIYLELRSDTWVYLSTIFDQASKQITVFNIGKDTVSELFIKALLQVWRVANQPFYILTEAYNTPALIMKIC